MDGKEFAIKSFSTFCLRSAVRTTKADLLKERTKFIVDFDASASWFVHDQNQGKIVPAELAAGLRQ
ncbi:MAG: hypothetical protein Q8S00_03600 [Deltaproteobacteria bacterium]|nr:hypothetical protein [Deltaproteobacteria bacterium]MDZ4347263.1 hypothetical protein [Candidatus Binatia bacterium]